MSREQTPEGIEGSTTIEIPDRLAARIEARVPATRFQSSDEYVEYVLEQMLAEVETEEGVDGAETAVDEEEVQTRLESLGYLE